MVATQVLVISGPIAAGKSSTAQLLASHARASGRTAAVLDLDRLYMMLDDTALMSNPAVSRQARRAAALLTDHFVLSSINLVVIEGEFWTQTQRDEFTGSLRSAVQPTFVTLRVSVDEALGRVQLDHSRRLSRIPEVLRASHAEFAVIDPIPTDLILDTTSHSLENVVARITGAFPAASELDSLFQDIDCLQIPVADLDAGLAFYRDALGHSLIWRTESAAGLRMRGCTAELVVQTDRPELEVNLSVASADAAAAAVTGAGGAVLVTPFDIAIGRCCVAQDPWGNRLVMLDHRNGRLVTDDSGRVQKDEVGRPRTFGSR